MTYINEEEIRQRVEQRMKARQEFWIHLGIYVAVNLFLWVVFFIIPAMGGENPFPWPIFVTGGWGIGIFSHAVETYYKTNPSVQERRERAIQAEIERERQRMAGSVLSEKPKREQSVRISDDGELIYEDEEPRRTARHRSRSDE